MKTLCVIPCGKRKVWDRDPNAGPTQAQFVYIGPFASACRRYAQNFHQDRWCILSAKHGILFPGDIVPSPYNVTFNDKSTAPVSEDFVTIQAKRLQSVYERIVVLGGRNYVDICKTAFPSSKIVTPLSGCGGIGTMMSKMKAAIESGTSLI